MCVYGTRTVFFRLKCESEVLKLVQVVSFLQPRFKDTVRVPGTTKTILVIKIIVRVSESVVL